MKSEKGNDRESNNLYNDLIDGNILSNLPKKIILEEGFETTIVLSSRDHLPILKAQIDNYDNYDKNFIKISPFMLVELKSPYESAFTVTSYQRDIEQPFNTDEPAKWKWFLIGKKKGVQTLIITVSRLKIVNEKPYWKMENDFKKVIEVKETFWQKVKKTNYKFWIGMVFVPILCAIIALFGGKRVFKFFKKRKQEGNGTPVNNSPKDKNHP